MDRRSQLMALAVAFVVAAALFASTAHAAGGCLANPTGAARSGKHWYYQTSQDTQQKCWFLGARKIAARQVAHEVSYNTADQAQPSEHVVATACAIAPAGHSSRGRRWFYQTDPTTNRKCWHLSGRKYRIAKIVPAQPPQAVQVAAAGGPSIALPPSVADAQASVTDNTLETEDAIIPLAPLLQPALPASAAPGPATDEDAAIPTFESRWVSDFNSTPAYDNQPASSKNPDTDRESPPATGKSFFKNTWLILAAGPPLIDILVVFVATLGSALILLGLLDWSFLFRGFASTASEPRSSLKLPKLEVDAELILNNQIEASMSSGDGDEMPSHVAPAVATEIDHDPRLLLETA